MYSPGGGLQPFSSGGQATDGDVEMLDGGEDDSCVEVSDELTDRLLSCDDGDESEVSLSEDSELSNNDSVKVIWASIATKSVPLPPPRLACPPTALSRELVP